MKKHIFRKGCMYGNHMNPAVECVSAGVRPKKENRKNENDLNKKPLKISLEKGMDEI